MKTSISDKIRAEKLSVIVLAAAAVIFIVLLMWAQSGKEESIQGKEYVEYEKARVTSVLNDTVQVDPASDNASRGEQMLTVTVLSGQYKGEELLAYNYVGPIYGVPLHEGDSAVILISTYATGDHNATVYEYNRIPAIIAVLILFFIITIIVGGRTGLKSLLGLIFTVICLFMILLPALFKGAPTIISTLLMCTYIALVSFTILGGVHRKTIVAFLGTFSGTLLATIFGLASQSFARIDGLRVSNVEPLLQLRQMGSPVGLRGLLVAGIIISALGAVMDVAMSISSALEEVHAADPTMDRRGLFNSGMNIGRDMVGTMTNTLILAFLGSGFVLIMYLFSLGLSFYQLFSSAYLSIEVISGISSSIGMILAIPLTALISAEMLAGSDK